MSGPTAVPTPLFTRHTLGAIEGERDDRHVLRARDPHVPTGQAVRPRPRIAATVAARARRAKESRDDTDRWIGEGGHLARAA